MARHTTTYDSPPKGCKSPRGFWPNPDEEMFYKARTPPWEVPNRRKTRGNKINYVYDLTGEELIYMKSGEVTTKNKFELLEETSSSTEPSRKKREETPLKSLKSSEGTYDDNEVRNYSRNILYPSYDDFMSNRGDCDDNNINYMYTNKYNFCSGYFPEFITLDNDVAYNFSKMNNYSNYYYLYTNNNKYLKQLSNCNSRYDGKYFNDMNFAYKVSKKLNWNYGTGKDAVLFKNSYFYRKNKSQALGETRISIPKDLDRKNRSQALGETRISIPKDLDRTDLYGGSRIRASRREGEEEKQCGLVKAKHSYNYQNQHCPGSSYVPTHGGSYGTSGRQYNNEYLKNSLGHGHDCNHGGGAWRLIWM